jgi:hypothetical protein
LVVFSGHDETPLKLTIDKLAKKIVASQADLARLEKARSKLAGKPFRPNVLE